MIVGLLLIGSMLGGAAALVASLVGQPLASVALIYVATGVFSILAISLGCAFRPRRSSAKVAQHTHVPQHRN